MKKQLRRPVISTISDPYTTSFKCDKPLPLQMSTIFSIEKGAAKKTQIFHVFERLFFCNGQPYWGKCWRALRDFCGVTTSFKCDKPLPLQVSTIFSIEKGAAKKTQIFHVFERLFFCNGQPYWGKCWRALRDFCGVSKKCDFATFPEI